MSQYIYITISDLKHIVFRTVNILEGFAIVWWWIFAERTKSIVLKKCHIPYGIRKLWSKKTAECLRSPLKTSKYVKFNWEFLFFQYVHHFSGHRKANWSSSTTGVQCRLVERHFWKTSDFNYRTVQGMWHAIDKIHTHLY